MGNNSEITYEPNIGLYFRYVTTSIEDISKRKVTAKHSHPQYEIYWLKTGKVTYHVNGHKYQIKHGELLVLNAYEYHMVEVAPTEPYERYNIHVPISLVPVINEVNLFADFFNENPYITIIPAEIVTESKIPQLFADIENSFKEANEYLNQVILADTIKLAVEINRLIKKPRENNRIEYADSSNTHPAISKCIQYINSNLYRQIYVDEIAKHVMMSKSRLQHLFKEYTGSSLSYYLLKQKMQTAIYLLKTGQSPCEVSNSLGYAYYSTFCNSFKKFFGVSPQKIKK